MANGRLGRKAKVAERRAKRANKMGTVVTAAMDEPEAMRLAAAHLATLHDGDVPMHKPVRDKLVSQPTQDNHVRIDCHSSHTHKSFSERAKSIRDQCMTDARLVCWLLVVANAQEIVCESCALGPFCEGRIWMHFGAQMARLAEMAEGMGLSDCCWWHSPAQ